MQYLEHNKIFILKQNIPKDGQIWLDNKTKTLNNRKQGKKSTNK